MSPAPSTVAEVIDAMATLSARLPPGDGARAFNEMYLTTTRHVARAIEGERFADSAFMARLDVVFACLFLDAHAADASAGQVPRSWRALFEARARRDVSQLQFAVAGMNAHINFDLPRALVATLAELGGGLDDRRRADYLRINAILGETQDEVRRELVAGPYALVDEALGEHDDRVALWGIVRAREFAWTSALTLQVVDGTFLEGRFVDAQDRIVELSSRLILGGTP